MDKHLINPFFFEIPSSRWEFTDRTDEIKALQRSLSQTGRRILMYGRRRMGKTSILEEVVRKGRDSFLMVDVSTAASIKELAEKLLSSMPIPPKNGFGVVLEIAQKHLKEVAIEAGRIKLSAVFRPQGDETTLESVLNVIHDYAETTGALRTVILDEFQDIRTIGGPKVDWKLRGTIQRHRHLNYVFTGSDHRLVAWMNDPEAPFFKQLELMEIHSIDPVHLAGWLRDRAKTGGMTKFPYSEQVVAVAGPCTGDIVRLAKKVFDFAAEGREGDVITMAFDAIALIELNTEFNALWRSVTTPNARSMLRAIATGQAPTSSATLRQYGITSPSTAGTAIAWLLDRQILARAADGRVVFDSPFVRRWVQFNAA